MPTTRPPEASTIQKPDIASRVQHEHRDRTVLVLHEAIGDDARADEQDTLIQRDQVCEALNTLGWNTRHLATGLDLESTMTSVMRFRPACIFNLVESLGGQGRLIHFVPALLQGSGYLFTGCSSDAIYSSSHKLMAKNRMRQCDIRTPEFFSLGDTPYPVKASNRWIVKSVWEHASFGLDDGCVVKSVDAAVERIFACTRRHGGEWFAEEFVDGREFNISVLECNGRPQILPMAEMTFVGFPPDKPRIVGYAAKWDEEAPEFHATQRIFPELPAGLHHALQEAVMGCWKAFGLSGYARVDFRVDADGNPWVLEVNANPCIARDAGFTVAAQQAGISHDAIVKNILEAAGVTNTPAGLQKDTLTAGVVPGQFA